MNTLSPLFRFVLSAETDFIWFHSVCLQIANWAGVNNIEQLYFAFSIIEKCDKQMQAQGEVCFFLIRGRNPMLKVTIKSAHISDTVEILLPALPDLSTKPAIQHDLVLNDSTWKPEYRDLQHFNYALSHDLKNSLAKLKLALSLLEEEEVPSHLRYYIEIIHRSSVKLESTMLSLNKIIELGHNSAKVVQSICPAAVFEEVAEDFLDGIHELKKDFDDIDSITYIEVYLKSLYTNMLSNAVKYASPDRPLVFSVAARKEGNMVVLSFTDNGQGIDLETYNSKIFHPFTRFSNKAEGSGMGLYLVKSIVERNGGRVEVESELDKGTTFRFYLREYEPAPQPEKNKAIPRL
ncbi:MAG: sensor histidine kinase [Agriterribacter sp.]